MIHDKIKTDANLLMRIDDTPFPASE